MAGQSTLASANDPNRKYDKYGNPYSSPKDPEWEQRPDGSHVIHADPGWRRYQQPPTHPIDEMLAGLKSLMPKPRPDMSPIPMPKAPGLPPGFQAQSVGDPNIPDTSDVDTSNLQTHAVPGTRMNVTGGMDNLDSVLEGLRTATGTERGDYSTDGELYRLQDARRDELARNLELEAKYPGNPNARNFIGQPSGFTSGMGGTRADLASLDEDIAKNPVAIQQKLRVDQQNKDYLARNAGYASPAEQAKAQFALEQSKVNSPTEVAKIQGQTLRDVEKLKETNAQGQLDTFKAMLAGGLIPAGMNIRAGGVSIGQQQPPAGGVGVQEKTLAQLQKELDNLERPALFNYLNPDNYSGARAFNIQRKKEEIAELQRRMSGRGGGGAPAPQVPTGQPDASAQKRNQAISELQRAGHPVTEANINYVMSQLP